MGKRLDFTIESPRSCTAIARAGKRLVGMATAWHDSDGRWVILRSEVRPKYRRRGIATAMYRSIEATSGKQLSPAISLSDDAFHFWNSYRPEAVADDLRHIPDLIGRKAQKNGRPGKIIKATGNIAIIEFDDRDNTIGYQSYIRRTDLQKHLI
jgi:hypothetical protein